MRPYTPPPPKPWSQNTGEKLYNGIVLPEVWPPQDRDPKSIEPMPVPYLDHPPAVIPIDVGRQLFVDDFLSKARRSNAPFIRPGSMPAIPFSKPRRPRTGASAEGERGEEATVFLGQGGVFYDPAEQIFKMFYVAGWRGGLGLATSRDMIHWTRPELDLAGGNLLLPQGVRWTGATLKSGGSDNCVWLDLNAASPQERIKFLTCWMHVPVSSVRRGSIIRCTCRMVACGPLACRRG